MCDFSEIPTANRVKLLIDCGGNSLGKLTVSSQNDRPVLLKREGQ